MLKSSFKDDSITLSAVPKSEHSVAACSSVVERSSQSPDTCNLCSSWSGYAAWLHWECVCMCGSICVLVWERVCVWMGACVFFPARLDHQWFAVLHCTESPTQGEGVKGRALHVLTHIPSSIYTRTHTHESPQVPQTSLFWFLNERPVLSSTSLKSCNSTEQLAMFTSMLLDFAHFRLSL